MEVLKQNYTVTEEMTAKVLKSGTLPVFATPALVACMEDTAKTILEPILKEGETSVGTQISTTHIKASPVGAVVEIEAKLVNSEGRIHNFEITAAQDGAVIANATHTRAVISIERFMAKLK